jgi:hypothetical protein
MTEHFELNESKSNTKEQMMGELVKDSSRAFLDDLKPAMTQTKLEAESQWWQGLGKDNRAPATLGSAQEVKALADKGWKVEENQGYRYISRESADGKMREADTYEKASGMRLNQTFYRFDNKDAMASNKFSQVVDAIFRDDGKSPLQVEIRSGDYENRNRTEFTARFNENGKLARAEERGMNRDSNYYSFRQDGSLYEALTRSYRNSSVTNDQLFNSAGQPRSDYNPLYLYEKMRRPVDNLYRGWIETRRSGGMF